jgi:protein TonB
MTRDASHSDDDDASEPTGAEAKVAAARATDEAVAADDPKPLDAGPIARVETSGSEPADLDPEKDADAEATDARTSEVAEEDDAPAAEVDVPLGEVRLDDAWREEPNRPVIERFRPALGLTAAVVLHGAIAVAGYASFASISDRIGGGGSDELSISVELITREALDAVRASRQPQPNASARTPTAPLAPTAGAEREQSASQETQDGAPPEPTDPPAKRPEQPTAPIVAKPAEAPAPDAIAVAPARGRANLADEAADPISEPPEKQPETETPEAMPKPTRSQAASQAQDAREASAKGGAVSRSLRVTSALPTASRPAQAARAAGQAARGYAAELVKALVRLEDHLQDSSNSRQRRLRGRVELLLRLGRDGQIEQLRVARSSGNAALDNQAIRDVGTFRFPSPPSLLTAGQRTFRLPITYR